MMLRTSFLLLEIKFHNLSIGMLLDTSTSFTMKYSRTSLIRTPGDNQNPFVLSGIRINRCNLY